MSADGFAIDMMELADIGQPTKIAHEIHRQLREQFGSVPRRMPLAALSTAVGIVGIKLFDDTNFEGTLVVHEGRGAIGIRKGMRSGRHNFTLAHEIGHFLIPTHRFQRQEFLCEPADMRRVRAGNFGQLSQPERIEVEANEFAAALVVPLREYGSERKTLGSGCDVAHIRQLAETFDVSQEVMAKIYVMNADEKAAIVTSKDGVVQRVIPQPRFPFLGLRKGSPIPSAAVTHSFSALTANYSISELLEVPTAVWLEENDNVSAIYEQVVMQEEGWAMTLLIVDQREEDEDASDED